MIVSDELSVDDTLIEEAGVRGAGSVGVIVNEIDVPIAEHRGNVIGAEHPRGSEQTDIHVGLAGGRILVAERHVVVRDACDVDGAGNRGAELVVDDDVIEINLVLDGLLNRMHDCDSVGPNGPLAVGGTHERIHIALRAVVDDGHRVSLGVQQGRDAHCGRRGANATLFCCDVNELHGTIMP